MKSRQKLSKQRVGSVASSRPSGQLQKSSDVQRSSVKRYEQPVAAGRPQMLLTGNVGDQYAAKVDVDCNSLPADSQARARSIGLV